MALTGRSRAAQAQYDLLGGASDLAALGILAARVAAALRREVAGDGMDDLDRGFMADLASLFTSSADAVRFFGTSGQQGHPPSAALSARVDLAIGSLPKPETVTRTPEQLADMLSGLADSVTGFVNEPDPDTASLLLVVCSSLADSALRETGSTGESTSTFPMPSLHDAGLATVR
jgi:hypothetical protein